MSMIFVKSSLAEKFKFGRELGWVTVVLEKRKFSRLDCGLPREVLVLDTKRQRPSFDFRPNCEGGVQDLALINNDSLPVKF